MQPPSTPSSSAERRTIARASLIMFVALTLGRILGFVRDATITHLYGQGNQTDIFNMAFFIPDLIFMLIAGGALTAAFIPVFTDYLTQANEEEAWRVFNILATALTLVVTGAVIAAGVFAVPLARRLLDDPRFTPADIEQCAYLMRIVLPAQICFLLGGLMMGAQQSRQRFLVPALGPVIYNLSIIIGGVALSPRLGIAGFSWGALGGAVLGNLLLQYTMVRRMGLRYRPACHLGHPGGRRGIGMMGAVVLSLALPQILTELNRAFGVRISDGVASALANTNRLMQAPLAMFGQSLAVALLPTLSAYAAARRVADFRETLSRSLRAILFTTIPISALMIALSAPLIRMVFEHGEFTASDTALAAPILAAYSIAVPAWSAQAVVARACFALGDNRTPVFAGIGVSILFVLLNLALRGPFGGPGLAAATSFSGLILAVVMGSVLRRHLGGLDGGEIARSAGKTALASLPAAAIAWGIASVVESSLASQAVPSALVGLLQCSLGGGAGLLLFAAGAVALRIPEAHGVWDRIRRKLRRS